MSKHMLHRESDAVYDSIRLVEYLPNTHNYTGHAQVIQEVTIRSRRTALSPRPRRIPTISKADWNRSRSRPTTPMRLSPAGR